MFLEPSVNPGVTWTPVYRYNSELLSNIEIEEPQDRIDHIYYRGSGLSPIGSKVYHGSDYIELYPFHRYNDWPSDHSAVITDFIVQI